MADKTIRAILVGEDRSASKAMKGVGDAADQAAEKIAGAGEKSTKAAEKHAKATESISKKIDVMVGNLLAQGLMKVADFAVDSIGKAISGAANLEQSIGAIDAVFKGNASQMHAWAATAATDVGLTKNEFNELGTLIGTQLRNGGTSMEELAPKTRNLITLGADLASMYGGTTKEAVEALSSALKGEYDPLEKFGGGLKKAEINARAAAWASRRSAAHSPEKPSRPRPWR